MLEGPLDWKPAKPDVASSLNILILKIVGFHADKKAQMLVSRWTLRRRVVKYGLEETTGFSMISDEQLDNLIENFMSD